MIAAPPFADSAVPALTADPKDDPILYTALVADADLALTFETLLADHLGDVDWDEIDGSWLTLAHARPG